MTSKHEGVSANEALRILSDQQRAQQKNQRMQAIVEGEGGPNPFLGQTGERDTAMELQRAIEKAQRFVENNMFPVRKGISVTQRIPRCVDGGYRADQFQDDSFARPGADGGYVEALLAVAKQHGIEISAQYAVELVDTAVKGLGRTFQNHTDAHAKHHNHDHKGDTVIGCGHEAKAVEFPGEYGVDAQTMQGVIEILVQGQNTVLDRKHTEDAVLIVHGHDYSVRPWNTDQTEMNFVYDADVDDAVMRAIWRSISSTAVEFSSVAVEDFIAAAQMQTGATVEKLATSKGKPTLHVRFDEEGKPTVSAE